MGLVDYISRNPYQPAKSVSKYDEEFLVATLSSIHSDAQLLQRKHNFSANSLHKLYIDIDGENKNSTTNTEQVLTINYVTPNPQTKIHDLLVPRNNSSKFCSKQTSNLDMNSAQRVRLTNVSSNLAAPKYNSNVTSLKFNHQYSTHAPRVHLTDNTKSVADQKHNSFLHSTNSINCTSAHDQRVHSTQNGSVFAHTYPTSKINTSNLINTTSDFASRVRFSFNNLTPARHNTLFFTQKTRMHSSDDSFAKQVTKYPIHSKFASHSLPFTTNIVQIESQMLVNTKKASLAYQNTSKFTPISHSHLSIENQPQIPTFFSKPHSNTLNNARAQLTNNKQVLFAKTQPEIQLSSSLSINLIEKTQLSSTMSQQASSLKGKSISSRLTRASPRVSFTDNATTSTPRRSSSHSNLSTPLTDSPQVMSFERVVGKVFSKSLIASLTSKNAVLKEVRDCIIRGDEEKLKALNPYLHSYWRDLHVTGGCVCMDEKVAIPNALKDALIDDLHASHPGSWGMVCMAQHCWWPYMNRDLLVKAIECKSCTAIGKNLKSVIPAKQFKAHTPCIIPNQKIQIDFVGPINNEKEHEIYILTCIDRFSKYPSAELVDNANSSNVIKFLDNYIQIHGDPRSLRIDQARCLVGNQVKNFCTKNKITLIPAPANDHRAIGLVERLIGTIRQRLACIKKANKEVNSFTIEAALKSIIYQLRICKHRTTKLSPFESHFGRKANTPLSNLSTQPKSSDLSYEKILNHYLDEETVTPNELLPEEQWGNSRSDDEIERNMCKATKDATTRERLATDNESRFLRTTQAHRTLPLKDHAVQLNIARKKHLHKRSKKNLDGLYEVLAPGSVVQKTDQYASVIREPGKMEVTVRNSDIAKFGTREERKTKLTENVNRRGPRTHEKTTEAKILSHIKECTRIQKGDRKMEHRKRETGSGLSSNKSNIARAMRVRMPKVPDNFALQVIPEIPEAAPEQQIITGEVLIAPPPINTQQEVLLSSPSVPTTTLPIL